MLRRATALRAPRMALRAAPRVACATLPLASRATTGLRWCKGGPVEDSPDTHPDFHSKPILPEDDLEEVEAIKADIRDTIETEDIVLFMKGMPEAPVCGFSKRVVDILDALGLEFTSFDVLAHPTVRSYVKEVSEWPTIPQLFIKGDFVGGTDIIVEMAGNGQLQLLLEKHKIDHRQIKL